MPEIWISKDAAAERLTTSKRTIERRIRAGKIETKNKPREGQPPETLCNADDVDALRPGGYLMPPSSETRELQRAEPPAQLTAPPLADIIAATFHAATMNRQPNAIAQTRAWLLLDEAAAVSGLSRRLIRQAIKDGEIMGIKDGKKWKVLQRSVMEWIPATPTKQTQQRQPPQLPGSSFE